MSEKNKKSTPQPKKIEKKSYIDSGSAKQRPLTEKLERPKPWPKPPKK